MEYSHQTAIHIVKQSFLEIKRGDAGRIVKLCAFVALDVVVRFSIAAVAHLGAATGEARGLRVMSISALELAITLLPIAFVATGHGIPDTYVNSRREVITPMRRVFCFILLCVISFIYYIVHFYTMAAARFIIPPLRNGGLYAVDCLVSGFCLSTVIVIFFPLLLFQAGLLSSLTIKENYYISLCKGIYSRFEYRVFPITSVAVFFIFKLLYHIFIVSINLPTLSEEIIILTPITAAGYLATWFLVSYIESLCSDLVKGSVRVF